MADESGKEHREHEITVHVFSISAGLVGVCLTAISLIRVVVAQTKVSTAADDLLAADAILFMVCCFLSFGSFKTSSIGRRRLLRKMIDGLFMVALAIMVAVCALIAYAII